MVEYKFESENQRAAVYDEGHLTGVCEYEVKDGAWFIMHTQVDPAYRGQNIARQLLDMVVHHAESANIQIVPVCSYAVRVLG